MPAQTLSLGFITLACVAIALGRHQIRRERRVPSWRRRAFGWTLVFAGMLLMIAGVVSW